MEILSVLLFIVIIILITSLKTSISNRLTKLEEELRRLREQPVQAPVEKSTASLTIPVAAPEKEIITKPLADIVRPVPETPEEKTLSSELEALLQHSEPPQNKQVPADQGSFKKQWKPEPEVIHQSVTGFTPEAITQHKPSFFERNPDLEKFIGENLVSKIGIGILVLAIGFFVKYAIDNDWIGPVGRVGVGILCGGILAAIAHWLRNSYKGFSSVLIGGALAIFYFTITLAYHQFHLFSQTVAFIIMVIITGFAVVLSQLYNRQELAIIALIGGFATPFMVSEGNGNYKSLFSYLIILNTGLLVIAYNKAWRLLNLLAFLFTVILFGSWMFMLPYNTPAPTYANALLFATVFYGLFFIINIAHNVRENKKFLASDFGILLANTCLYFGVGLYCLSAMNAEAYRGMFTIAMGILNFAVSFVLFRNKKTDTNILYLLIGVTLSFISLTAPIQLNGNNITLFWASESVLLYWLFQKSKIRIIRLTSFIVWGAMLISLIMDWVNVYGTSSVSVPVITNKAFITTIFAALASYLLFILRTKEPEAPGTLTIYQPGRNLFRIAGILLLFAAGSLETYYQFNRYYPDSNLHILYMLLYSFVFVLLFIFIRSKIATLNAGWFLKTILMFLCILAYLFFLPATFQVQSAALVQQRLLNHFAAHWVSALLLAIIIYLLVSFLRQQYNALQKNINALTWLLCGVIVIFLSAEVHLLVNSLFYSNTTSLPYLRQVYVKTGLPILWGLCSFGFMWQGMKLKFRTLRIVSLTLFLVILLKLFLFDIRNIPVAGKIAAFFCLGVLLLVVSFMYQRLKKIIIEDEKKPVI